MKNNNFYKNLIENNLNPFILFDNNGDLQEFNKEAEFLFNTVSPKELYSLAIQYASHSFGFEYKFINLKYGQNNYYAILVGYLNENEIGIQLYKEICTELLTKKMNNIEFVNIFSLIEISKTTTLLQNTKIQEIYDVSIPEIKININEFLLTLNNCFTLFKQSSYLKIKISLEIGEYEIIKKKKYQIIFIKFINNKKITIDREFEYQAHKAHINLFVQDKTIKLKFPMIL